MLSRDTAALAAIQLQALFRKPDFCDCPERKGSNSFVSPENSSCLF